MKVPDADLNINLEGLCVVLVIKLPEYIKACIVLLVF